MTFAVVEVYIFIHTEGNLVWLQLPAVKPNHFDLHFFRLIIMNR